jgi:PAS domain S-box-containing protein
MHKLVARQVRKHLGDVEKLPPEMRAFIADVSAAYEAADADRLLVERSLELTSQELMHRNQALRESELRYRRIVETATEGILLTDPQGKITFANERMADILGWHVEELLGRSRSDFIEKADGGGESDEHVAQASDQELRRKDNSTCWAIVSSAPIHDADGAYQGGLAMFTDITARKRAETEVRRAYERLKELDEFRSQFINNAAHELGTPLTPIKLQVHMLRNAYWKDLDPAQQKATKILERNVERLAQLVGDILDVAKIQSGKLNLKFQKATIAPMVRDAAESFQAAALDKSITLEVAAESGLECHVDPRRLGQILYNLITNALKFTPANGKISVVARRIGDFAQIVVHDTGRGIAPEDVAKLFRPFSQVHDMMQVTAAGTGLGLFISRGMAEQMGGRIWCESAGIGKGCNFFVEIPLASTIERRARTLTPQSAAA